MHHALLVPDVLDHILGFIKADWLISRSTFTALARTCSALSEASLDALWSDLSNLHPLVSCIYGANMKLSDERTAEVDTDAGLDLSVFHKYAYRVRKLELSGFAVDWTLDAWSTSVADDLGVLHILQVPTPLLPNLNHLVWPDGVSLTLLWPLLNPRLLSLHIPRFQWSPKSTPWLLPRIQRLCPELSSLTLLCDAPQESPYQRVAESCLSRVICSWKKLKVLECNPMGRECILSLPVLSSLRVLRFRVDNSSVLDLPANSLSFPSLHAFRLETNSPGAYSLLQAMKSLPKSIEIVLIVRCSGWNAGYGLETVELILHPIAQNASYNNLEEFRMTVPAFPSGSIINGSNVLRPLFLCCNLRVLRIIMTPQFILGDDDLRAMSSAWPQLEELELYHNPYAMSPDPPSPFFIGPPPTPPPISPSQPPVHLAAAQPALQGPLLPHPSALFLEYDETYLHSNRATEITLQGLISLLRLCPNLRFFNLAIDTTKLDGLQDDEPGDGVCNRLVKYPRLVDSPISDPEAVARILLDIFPELETICGEGSHYTTMFNEILPQGWLQVEAKILASKAARGHET
ncbi:uncharacterized protein EDB91DRAFT_1134201 [Suillus paluster]|uniref:uncharacterized protein n=1 Tax=Suillus paluster TaxID=48578 RepID=UPI001B87E731|nr:uncharacterized protein EDB91DRAFT_1134201 [Suillus paluster]KAG1739863.1 hypothetical protein EDB91DRAFT_1134201 [Suillus paluster]